MKSSAVARPWLRILTLASITLLGVSGSIGSILQIGPLQAFGHLSGASPIPLVFNQFQGIEYWGSKGRVVLQMEDGSEKVVPIDDSYYQAVRGPHMRKLAYTLDLSVAPVIPRARLRSRLQYAFCGTSPLKEDLRIESLVESVRVEYQSTTPGFEFTWSDKYECR